MTIIKFAILVFTIAGALQVPAVTTITPASASRGSSVNVTLAGTDFEAGMTVNAGEGVTVTNVVVSSTIAATADFTIADSASPGQRNLTVTTGGGTSAAKTFTVAPPPPTFTA